jgi:hypothetical protein
LLKTDIKEAGAEKFAGSDLMAGVKRRLDTLQSLLKEGYVTANEYETARVNIFSDAGLDIAARARFDRPRRVQQPETYPQKASTGRGYGHFWFSLFLIFGVTACAAFFLWTLTGGGPFGVRGDGSALPFAALNEFIARVRSADFGDRTANSGGENSAGLENSAAVQENLALPQMPVLRETPAPRPYIYGMARDATPSAFGVPAEESTIMGWGVVSAYGVRIRAAPDVSADNIVGQASLGERFAVLAEGEDRDGAKWYNVRRENGESADGKGWIKASLMRFEE